MSKRKVKLATEGPFVQVTTTSTVPTDITSTTTTDETDPNDALLGSTPKVVPWEDDQDARVLSTETILTHPVQGTVSVDGLADIGILIGSSLSTQDALLEAVNALRTDIQVLQDLQVNKDNPADVPEGTSPLLSEVANLIKIKEYAWVVTQNAYASRAEVKAASSMIPLIDAKIMKVLMGAEFGKYLAS